MSGPIESFDSLFHTCIPCQICHSYILHFRSSTGEDVEFYNSDELTPVYERLPRMMERQFTVEEIADTFDPDQCCVSQAHPVRVEDNVSFVIDTKKLKHSKDYKADDMGVWGNNRVDTSYFHCYHSSGNIEINRITDFDEDAFQMKRIHYKHGRVPSPVKFRLP